MFCVHSESSVKFQHFKQQNEQICSAGVCVRVSRMRVLHYSKIEVLTGTDRPLSFGVTQVTMCAVILLLLHVYLLP
jgi:hypothetical protein